MGRGAGLGPSTGPSTGGGLGRELQQQKAPAPPIPPPVNTPVPPVPSHVYVPSPPVPPVHVPPGKTRQGGMPFGSLPVRDHILTPCLRDLILTPRLILTIQKWSTGHLRECLMRENQLKLI